MNNSTTAEWHPWLKMFAIMAVPAGLLFLVPSLIDMYDNLFLGFGTGISNDFPMLLWGAITIISSIYALRVTDYFRHWNNGITKWQKGFASYAIMLGVCLCIALIIVGPIMRVFTDSVGGGRNRS